MSWLTEGFHGGSQAVSACWGARGLNLSEEAPGSGKALNDVPGLPFDGIVRIGWRVIVEQIRGLNKSIAELEETIGEEGSKLEGHQSLTSIKGIGKTTGAILLSVIGDVNDFAGEGRLARKFLKRLWGPPTELQASGFRSVARGFGWIAERCPAVRVRYAVAEAAAPWPPARRSTTPADRGGRPRRKPDAEQFPRLTEGGNQVVADKTS
ncbi:MAG: transposase [Bryobacterales bacterium]|nr:transposase [Bryobacterales bacterium]